MLEILLSKEQVERLIETCIRVAEVYQQRALECERQETIQGYANAAAFREQSRLAAADAHTLQVFMQSHQGG